MFTNYNETDHSLLCDQISQFTLIALYVICWLEKKNFKIVNLTLFVDFYIKWGPRDVQKLR